MAVNADITNIKIYRNKDDISQDSFEKILLYILDPFDD